MMKDKKEIAKLISDELKKGDIKSTISLISKELEKEKTDKLQFTKTPLLNSIGQVLGKLIIKENWKFESLMELWKEGKRDEKLIVISALGIISKKDYENTKQFVSNILNDISDWETCDQLALREIKKKDEKAVFEFSKKWARVGDKNTRWIIKEGMKKLSEKEQRELKSLMSG